MACYDGAATPRRLSDGTISRYLLLENCHVMAMGGSPASLIGQQGSNSLNALIIDRMNAAEPELLKQEKDDAQQQLRAWLERRRALPHDSYGSQSRLCSIDTYTDDPRAVVVGVRRTVRFLQELFDLGVRRLQLQLADPKKWSVGSSGTWVGVCFSSTLGLVWLPRQKALKLMEMAATAADGKMTAGEWREMLGFLEHVWSVVKRHRYTIDRLWTPCQRGGVLETQGPAALVIPTAEHRVMLARAAHTAANTPGASLLACVASAPRPHGAVRWVLIGDAAREEGDLAAGLGGHLYHLWCYMALTQEMFDAFDTPHLEFIQAGMLAITHSQRLRHARWCKLAADALATPTVLSGRARSRLMREIHDELLAHPDFLAYIRPRLRLETDQRWGVGNGIGDAASRAQFDRVERLYAQLGVTPTRICYSPGAMHFLTATLLREPFQARIATARLWRELTGEVAQRRATHLERPVLPCGRDLHLARAAVQFGNISAADEWASGGYIVIDVRRPGPLGNPWPVSSTQNAEWAITAYQRYLLAPRRKVGAVVRQLGGTLHDSLSGDGLRRLALRRDDEVLRLAQLVAGGSWLYIACSCSASAPCHRSVVASVITSVAAQLAAASRCLSERETISLPDGPWAASPPDGLSDNGPSPPASPPSSPPSLRPPMSSWAPPAASPPPSPTDGLALPRTPEQRADGGDEAQPQPPPAARKSPPSRCLQALARLLPSTPPSPSVAGRVDPAERKRLTGAESPPDSAAREHPLVRARRRAAGWWLPRTPPVVYEPPGARFRGAGTADSSPVRLPPPAIMPAEALPDAASRRRLTLPATPPALKPLRRSDQAAAAAAAVIVNAADDRAQGLVEASARLPGRLAPRPDDQASWLATVRDMLRLQSRAAPRNTLNQENSNLKHWRAWCDHLNTDIIRPSVHHIASFGDDSVAAEQILWAAALPFIMNRMNEAWVLQPKGRQLPPKPSSAMAVLRGVRRIHVKRLGIETVSLTAAVQVCDGMLREYAERHGPEALIPRRKEPFTRELILGLLNISNGTRLSDGSTVNWDTLEWRMMRALICFMAQSGFRKCTVSLPTGRTWGPMHLSLSNVVWRIHAWGPDVVKAPSAIHFALLTAGDFALVRPPPDKADQLSLHWGADPIYLPYDPDEPICAARELAEAELARACPPDQRRMVPLFTDGRGLPLRHHRLDPRLHAMLATLMPAGETHKYSWHSFRSWLACALLALKKPDGTPTCSDGTIQCLLRWRSPEALRMYARLNPAEYGGLLSRAVLADVSSVRTTNAHSRVAYDYDSHAARLQAALPGMYAGARAEDEGDDEPLDGIDADALGPEAL